jgi:hypothetical protein
MEMGRNVCRQDTTEPDAQNTQKIIYLTTKIKGFLRQPKQFQAVEMEYLFRNLRTI